MANQVEPFPALQNATIETFAKGAMFRGRYMSRVAVSNNKLRIMAWLQCIKLEEDGMSLSDALDQANSAFPYPKDASIQVSYATGQTSSTEAG